MHKLSYCKICIFLASIASILIICGNNSSESQHLQSDPINHDHFAQLLPNKDKINSPHKRRQPAVQVPYSVWELKPVPSNRSLPFDKELVKRLQDERQTRIHRVCNELSNQGEVDRREVSLLGHGNCYSLPDPHIMMCRMPKAGSKDLLTLLCLAIGPKCSPGIFQHLKRADIDELKNGDYFSSFFSFNTVRNPWTRLVSAYTQKFLHSNEYLYMIQAGKCRDSNKSLTAKHIRWTFLRFLNDCVIHSWREKGVTNMDEHWRPQHVLGSFCSIKYSYIHKLETADVDRTVLLYQFGVRRDFEKILSMAYSKRLPFEKQNMTTVKYPVLWSAVKSDIVDKLRIIYDLDMKLFDYPSRPI